MNFDKLGNVEFAVGDIVVLETGEYSAFQYTGVFKVAKPFKFDSEFKELLNKEWKPDYEGHKLEAEDVTPMLHRLGYIEDVEYTAVHLGYYDEPKIKVHHIPTDKYHPD